MALTVPAVPIFHKNTKISSIMKHLKSSVMFMAAAAITLASCSDSDELETQAEGGRVLTVTAECPQINSDTRTGIVVGDVDPATGNAEVKPIWKAGDKLIIAGENISLTASESLKADAEKASFLFTQLRPDFSQGRDFCFTNYEHINAGYDDNGWYMNFTATMPMIVEPNQISMNDIIVSEMVNPDVVDMNKPLELKFKRLSSLVRINFIDATENKMYEGGSIYRVTIDGDGAENCLLRDIKYYPSTGEIKTSPKYNVKVNFRENRLNVGEEGRSLYLACAPNTYKKGTVMKMEIGLSDYFDYYTKDLVMPADVELKPGEITTFNVVLDKVIR